MRDLVTSICLICVVALSNAQIKAPSLSAPQRPAAKPQGGPRLVAQPRTQANALSRMPPQTRPQTSARRGQPGAGRRRTSSPLGFTKVECDKYCKFPADVCARRSRCDGPLCYLCAETASVAAFLSKSKNTLTKPKVSRPPPTPPPKQYHDPWGFDSLFGFNEPSYNTGSNYLDPFSSMNTINSPEQSTTGSKTAGKKDPVQTDMNTNFYDPFSFFSATPTNPGTQMGNQGLIAGRNMPQSQDTFSFHSPISPNIAGRRGRRQDMFSFHSPISPNIAGRGGRRQDTFSFFPTTSMKTAPKKGQMTKLGKSPKRKFKFTGPFSHNPSPFSTGQNRVKKTNMGKPKSPADPFGGLFGGQGMGMNMFMMAPMLGMDFGFGF